MQPKIKTIEQYRTAISSHSRFRGWMFRGQADADWQLTPQAGRDPFLGRGEREVFESWRRQAVEHLESPHMLTDWDWLAIAQHHGLATRLLDWTTNPLTALFFAVESLPESDGAVYAAERNWERRVSGNDPFKYSGVGLFRPRRVASRIGRQFGSFTVHGPASLSLTPDSGHVNQLNKFVIRAESKKGLQLELAELGMDRATLFPGIEGVSMHMNWLWQMFADGTITPTEPYEDLEAQRESD